MSVSVKTYDFTIPAGGSVQIQAVGTYFRIQSSTGPISVTGEFGEVAPLMQGQGIKDSPFTRLQLRDLSGSMCVGKVIVASSEFIDQQMVLSGSLSMLPLRYGNPTSVRSFTSCFLISQSVVPYGAFTLTRTSPNVNVAITSFICDNNNLTLAISATKPVFSSGGFALQNVMPNDLTSTQPSTATIKTPTALFSTAPGSDYPMYPISSPSGFFQVIKQDRPLIVKDEVTFVFNTSGAIHARVDWDEW
ncbi:hypothetical protein [Limnohabitans sp.]|uniref:hypothetical protein n=1 Tax=Limnohabitans sp. TaxID=1907725 RepID=UPI00286F2197|nr:hypothetical protein [Limnohabitans sp.]